MNYIVVCRKFVFSAIARDATFAQGRSNVFRFAVRITEFLFLKRVKESRMAQTQYLVYLADDDEDDLELLATALQNVSCIAAVQSYSTTPQLIRQLSTLPLPDLIILDYHMPPSAEGELVRFIRSQKQMDQVTLIVYTTLLQESKKTTMLQDGVDSVMTKGTTVQEIADHVTIFCQIVANKKWRHDEQLHFAGQ